MTRRESLLPALLLLVHCKTAAAPPAPADAGPSASPAPVVRSTRPASAAAPESGAAAAPLPGECGREHWPEPWRARQTTTKPVYFADCAEASCVRVEPVVESGRECAGKCRPVVIVPRAVSPDPARARAIQALVDAETAEFRADDCWLTFLDYTIHHDAHGVLDISFRASGSGAYSSLQTSHLAIQLATLERIRADSAFSASARAELAATMNAEVRSAWKAAAKQHPEVFQQREVPAFRREHLENFVVHGDGVTFLFDFGLPHAVEIATPASEYAFSAAEIRRFIDPAGPLGFLAALPP